MCPKDACFRNNSWEDRVFLRRAIVLSWEETSGTTMLPCAGIIDVSTEGISCATEISEGEILFSTIDTIGCARDVDNIDSIGKDDGKEIIPDCEQDQYVWSRW